MNYKILIKNLKLKMQNCVSKIEILKAICEMYSFFSAAQKIFMK